MYYSSKGEELKKFHTRDGMAVELLLQKNIKTIIITKEKSKIVISRAKKIKVFKVYSGVKQKDKILNQVFISSLTYKVQNKYSDTINLENKSIENLIDKTYQELLIKLSQSI